MQTELRNALQMVGVSENATSITSMVKKMGAGDVPSALSKHFGKSVKVGDQEMLLEEYLRSRGVLTAGKANDFLMQISDGGVKFAQRIDRADQVTATAHKPGGAISRAGKGGAGVVINSFGNSAEVIRGIQAAVAAGVV
jgi:hypothetical protein